MMRTYLCGYRNSLFFGLSNHTDRILRRTMAQVQSCPGFLAEQNITRNNDVFHRVCNSRQTKRFCLRIRIHDTTMHQIDILTMRQHRNMKTCRLFHTLPVYLGIHDRFPILADCGTARLYHSFNIRQFFPELSFGHSPHLQYMNTVSGSCFAMNIPDYISIVSHRLRIGHCQHRRVTTVGCRLHAGKDIFLIL